MNRKGYWKNKRTPQEQEVMRRGICWDHGKKYTQLSKVPFKDLIKMLNTE